MNNNQSSLKMKQKREVKARPFLKWAGGKKALIHELLKYSPKEFNRYYEPFLGSGALFFALQPEKAYLSDVNKELINAYKQIKQNADRIISLLKKMKYNRRSYYEMRNHKPPDKFIQAARFIYLNKTCWNGLYRVNTKGEFNVPMGRYTNPTICDAENLRAVSKQLSKVHLRAVDFEEAVADAKEGDLVYLDPPYVTGYQNNGFIEYNTELFSLDHQERLRDLVLDLRSRGCKVIVSNADHRRIKGLYKVKGLKIGEVRRRSLIAGKKEGRRIITELIITNF